MIFDEDLSGLGCRKEGIPLPLSIIEHCLAKKELNNSAFSLKLAYSRKIGGMQGIFDYFGKNLVLTNIFRDMWIVSLIFSITEKNISS